VIKAVAGARGIANPERLDDTPADANPLALPGRAVGRVLSGDSHDVYVVGLAARRPVVFRLATDGREVELRLLPPGAGSVDARALVAGGTRNGSVEIHFVPPAAGRYLIDVRAIRGGATYTLAAAYDDRDGDFVPDHLDACPAIADPRQRDWDHDGDGDLCDRSSRVVFAGVARKGRRVRVRARMRPLTLPADAFRLRVARRVCGHGRCKLRPLRARRATTAERGLVELAFRLPPGRYRLTAALAADGYRAARSRPRSILVRR
jgi:hypothetical protein